MQTKNKIDLNKKSFSEQMAVLIAAALLILTPLAVDNAYFNIIEAKAKMVTVVFTASLVIILIAAGFSKGRCFCGISLNALDVSVLLGGIVTIVSCILCPRFTDAFIGKYGWGIGGFLIFAFALIYLFLSRNLFLLHSRLSDVFAATLVVITACLTFILTIADAMQLDPLGYHSGISVYQYFDYKSTIGNLNAHVGYISVMLPVLAIAYLREKNHSTKLMLFVVLILAIGELVLGATDGIFVAFGICAFFAVPYICKSRQRIIDAVKLAIIYGVWLVLAGNLDCFAENNAATSGVNAVVQSKTVSLAISILSTAALAFLHFFPKVLSSDKSRKTLMLTLEAALFCVVAYYLLNTIVTFSDLWGSNRGKIWRVSIEAYKKQPFLGKLFGIGPERQQSILCSAMGMPVYVCHSEAVQALLSTGILGLLCWGSVWAAVFISAIKNKLWEDDRIIFVLPLAAYFGQSFINSAGGLNVALLCVALAAFRRSVEKKT